MAIDMHTVGHLVSLLASHLLTCSQYPSLVHRGYRYLQCST
uniref:Uncharacterized protein n=1 Tax=Anguilla anguilla TaxID=7936 RepID=A0A0E9QPF0_ANGAN